MPILKLSALARGDVRIREVIPADDPVWRGSGIELRKPVRVDLEARTVGEGVLVRGSIEAELAAECRRCLAAAPVQLRDTVELLYEPLSAAEAVDLDGEVYALPERGDELDLTPALREQLVLRSRDYVVCSESCRGLCPTCGAELNRTTCSCVPESGGSRWDALKKIKFD